MKFLRMRPETWARTRCLLSSSTRNIALGNGSNTVPITSIESSLLIHSLRALSRRRSQTFLIRGQYQRAIFRYRDAVLEVRAEAAIFRHRRPFIIKHFGARPAKVHHRL